MGIHPIRLHGIDAFEKSQSCGLAADTGHGIHCGAEALAFVKTMIGEQDVVCELHTAGEKPWLSHGRYVATCYVGGLNIGAALVNAGWAVAHYRYGSTYKPLERKAKSTKAGAHEVGFVTPFDTRNPKKDEVKVCEYTAVDVEMNFAAGEDLPICLFGGR